MSIYRDWKSMPIRRNGRVGLGAMSTGSTGSRPAAPENSETRLAAGKLLLSLHATAVEEAARARDALGRGMMGLRRWLGEACHRAPRVSLR